MYIVDNRARNFLCGIFFEAIAYSIGPVVFGLYLFEAVGKKTEPAWDCYANWYYDEAAPG